MPSLSSSDAHQAWERRGAFANLCRIRWIVAVSRQAMLGFTKKHPALAQPEAAGWVDGSAHHHVKLQLLWDTADEVLRACFK